MRLATILTSMLLVLGLAAMGCDSGGDDSGDDTTTPGDDTSGGDDSTTPGDDTIVDPVCDPICLGKCGVIGECDCGGCEEGFTCVEATHTCAPDVVDPPDCETACANKECGDGGVAGCNCGVCAEGLTCNETTGMCEDICVPDCTGKQCGPDGCGGSCGLCPCVGCPPDATICNETTGQCNAPEALTCAGINECMMACNPEDPSYETCIQNCKDQGSTDAQNQFNALIQCAIDNGAQQCTTDQCVNDIIMAHCTDQYEACFPTGTMTCSELSDCIMDCAGDQACANDCASESTMDAISKYNTMIACVIEQCGEQPTQECWNAAKQGACAAMFADCFNLGKPGFATGPNGGSSADFVNMKMWLMGLDKDKLYNHH